MKKLIVLYICLLSFNVWAGSCPIPEPVGCPNTIIDMSGNTINGATTWTGDMVYSGSGSGLTYGNMSATNNSTTLSVDADLTETKITIFDTNGASNNVTVDATNDKMTVSKTGVYFIQCNTTLKGTVGVTQELHIRGRKNSGVSGKGKSLAAPVCATCDTDGNLITATHTFVNADVVYITATEYTNVIANTEYYVCEVAGTKFGLSDHVDGGGADCDAGNGDQIVIADDADVTGTFYQVGTSLSNLHVHNDVTAAGALVARPLPMGGIESLTSGDIIEFYVHTDDTTARAITVEDIFCSVIQIGG